jgi:hypothetical protein
MKSLRQSIKGNSLTSSIEVQGIRDNTMDKKGNEAYDIFSFLFLFYYF